MIKTRFAPSPTGHLHIGSIRTALYSWLYAKKHKGSFILRIEDTDLERSTQESVDNILEGLKWLGMDYEGPFYQTERLDRYRAVAQTLLDTGKAYRCYCSKERLDDLRAKQMENKEKPRYDGLCRNKNELKDEPHVIRFKNPQSGSVSFYDEIHGEITTLNSELDDLVLIRSNGMPTYNFVVAIDDMDMEITHVIRGEDHISNTPRQVNILNALGFKTPIYAHAPTILGHDGKRLSKRHGATNILQYRDEGFLPEAVLNYLVRLGWSHGDQEIFSQTEMIELFDLKKVNKAAAIFNSEKLSWLNQQYLKAEACTSSVLEKIQTLLKNFQVEAPIDSKLETIVRLLSDRCKTLLEIAEKSVFFYQAPLSYDEKAAEKHLNENTFPILKATYEALEQVSSENWTKDNLSPVLKELAKKLDVGFAKIAHPIRVALSGQENTPSLDITLELVGREETLSRLWNVINDSSLFQAQDYC